MTSPFLVCFVSICVVYVTGMGKDVEMTNKMRCSILNLHLEARKGEPARRMPLMTWNSRLAREALAWANDCMYEHQEGHVWGEYIGHHYLGENIAATSFFPDDNKTSLMEDMFQAWVDEKELNVRGTFEECCGSLVATCCHYTQVIWARTTEVGCAMSLCDPLRTRTKTFPSMLYLVCYYSPPGNTPIAECTLDWRPYHPHPTHVHHHNTPPP